MYNHAILIKETPIQFCQCLWFWKISRIVDISQLFTDTHFSGDMITTVLITAAVLLLSKYIW